MNMLDRIRQVAGLSYWPEFLSTDEECALVRYIEAQQHWIPFGRLKRRLCFGYVYGITHRNIVSRAPAIPQELGVLAVRLFERNLMTVIADQIVVQEYPAGVGIGAHIDAAVFGPDVCSLSLLSECVMQFRHPGGARFKQVLAPGSILAIHGAARNEWTHEIPGESVRARRLSVTFRSIAGRESTD